MRNFHRLAQSVNVAPLLATLFRHPELWDEDRLRTTMPNTPHADASDIILRFGKPSVDDHGPFHSRPSMAVLGALPTALSVMQLVGGSELGRVIITRLPPGGRILPHSDDGQYARLMTRHQVMLQSLPGNTFRCGEDSILPISGELWWFNTELEHEVINNSADDRIVLIVDCRIDPL